MTGRPHTGILLATLAVALLHFLSGCATTAPALTVVTRQLDIPASLLQCMPEPVARETWRTQRDVAFHLVKLAEAEQDCRDRLGALERLVDGQRLDAFVASPKGMKRTPSIPPLLCSDSVMLGTSPRDAGQVS